ncbi:MAG: hypothetical protein PHU80_07860, partial [Kiritimatiellae bacterium]|nr:hypothetical protein [Kiritimatiellia bacterium]
MAIVCHHTLKSKFECLALDRILMRSIISAVVKITRSVPVVISGNKQKQGVKMKLLHTMRLMAISLSACALVSSAFADTANDHIFDYTEKYNYYAFDSEKVTSDLAKGYFIFDDTFNYLGAVWFWRDGSEKYYSVESGILMLSADSASQKSGASAYQLFFMDDLLKKVMLSGDMYWALNGFGIARWASGQLTSLNVS